MVGFPFVIRSFSEVSRLFMWTCRQTVTGSQGLTAATDRGNGQIQDEHQQAGAKKPSGKTNIFFSPLEEENPFLLGWPGLFFFGRKFVSFRESGSLSFFFLESNEVKQERKDLKGKYQDGCGIFTMFFGHQDMPNEIVSGFCKNEPIVAIARLLCWLFFNSILITLPKFSSKKNLKSYRFTQ